MYPVPAYKRLLSYLYPVSLWKGASKQNEALELLLSRNNFQLVTEDSIYSDGKQYRPLVIAYEELENILPSLKNILVLGTGLGSAVEILNSQGYSPSFTLVDYDEVILGLAKQVLPDSAITYKCMDAADFIDKDLHTYNLVIVDIFHNRVVPAHFTSADFLLKCRNRLRTDGYLVLNYILDNKEEWDKVEQHLHAVFSYVKVLNEGINKIIIAKA